MKHHLARQVCDVELIRLGRVGGQQDQYAVAIGGLLHLKHEDGEVIEVNQLSEMSDIQYKRLGEHFALFSAEKETGRNAQDILKGFCDTITFSGAVASLCEEFLQALKDEDYGALGNLVGTHRCLKTQNFPDYMKKEEITEIVKAVGTDWKLCGAGKTGHVLISTVPEWREDQVKAMQGIWGPELPFNFVRYGTEIIHRE